MGTRHQHGVTPVECMTSRSKHDPYCEPFVTPVAVLAFFCGYGLAWEEPCHVTRMAHVHSQTSRSCAEKKNNKCSQYMCDLQTM